MAGMNNLMGRLQTIHANLGHTSNADQVGVTIQMNGDQGDQAPLSPRNDESVESFGEASLESFYDLISQVTGHPPTKSPPPIRFGASSLFGPGIFFCFPGVCVCVWASP